MNHAMLSITQLFISLRHNDTVQESVNRGFAEILNERRKSLKVDTVVKLTYGFGLMQWALQMCLHHAIIAVKSCIQMILSLSIANHEGNLIQLKQ